MNENSYDARVQDMMEQHRKELARLDKEFVIRDEICKDTAILPYLVTVNDLYGSEARVTYGSNAGGRGLTIRDAMRVMEFMDAEGRKLEGVAPVKTRACVAIWPSSKELGEKDEYRHGSQYFPIYMQADHFGASLRAWARLSNGTLIQVCVEIGHSMPFVTYLRSAHNATYVARSRIRSTQEVAYWGSEGRSQFNFFWATREDFIKALRDVGADI